MKYIKSKKGHSLLLVLVLTTIILVLGTAMLYSLTSETNAQKSVEQRTSALYLAQAGIEHGLSILERTQNNAAPIFPASSIIVINDGTRVHEYQITKTSSGIISKGRIIKNGSPLEEITLTAAIAADGTVTIQQS